MSITSAMFTGVSGLLANAEGINVIGNNLANVNTVGFKSGRMLFSDMLSVNIGNNSQIGRGTQIQKVDNIFGQGSFESTELVSDIALQGSSFFALKDPNASSPLTSQSQAILSRAGAFRVDGDRYLVNPDGYQVLDTSGNPIQFSDNATAINTAIAGGFQAAITSSATSAATAAAQYPAPATAAQTASTAALTAATNALIAANALAPANPAAVTAATAAVTAAQAAVNQANLAVSSSTSLTASSAALTAASTNLTATPNATNAATASDANSAVANYLQASNTNLTAMVASLNAAAAALAAAGAALPAGADATAATTAGTAAGTAATAVTTTMTTAPFPANYNTAVANSSTSTITYAAVADAAGQAFSKITKIDSSGQITYLDKQGLTRYYNATNTVGLSTATATAAQNASAQRIAVINPSNPGALDKLGGTLFQINAAAGVPNGAFSVASNAANGTSEKIYSNSLEQSNVDMAGQFVKMILTQRAYSANSKTIITADEMTQEVLNLKR